MDLSFTPVFLLVFVLSFRCSSSSTSLRKGSSLSVEKSEDIIISPNGVFSAGFLAIGKNAYSFAIWFTEPNSLNPTIVWMANRDQPVNGKRSKLSLLRTGNIVLRDASLNKVWSSDTTSLVPLELHLKDDGNLVLRELQGIAILWQSFDFPTNTLLSGQPLTRHTKLVSSRSESNHSTGFYKFFFDDENMLGLHYDGPEVSSSYWPKPWFLSKEVGRSNFNSSRFALLNTLGLFLSTDNFTFRTYDYGTILQRILKIDIDGIVRVYSRSTVSENWYVSWQAISNPCTAHGLCGPYSMCSYDPKSKSGRKCSCLPGYRLKNHNDWSYGCEPMLDLSCNINESIFVEIQHVEFYGYDNHYVEVSNYSACENLCLKDCTCKAFQHSYWLRKGFYRCFIKTQLLNGRFTPMFAGSTYLRFPRGSRLSTEKSATPYDHVCSMQLQVVYVRKSENVFVKFFIWVVAAVGAFEMVCLFMIWCFLIRTRQKTHPDQHGYHLTAIGFKKFTYSELKKVTKGFSQEIGRGAGGIVYKGLLCDERHVAVKRLYNAEQREGEFLAEVGIIGTLNHMNLIEMWGYCVEGKYKLLVYEYMENGSLAENLSSNTLDWNKRYKIALETARVLAYLHEECLEWILHCDIKPQNILLDSNYMPKLADFGLSKLQNRSNLNNPSISMIRGTRGYMAPEWIFNLPITSKVDVFSFGIVVLEMITGKSPTTGVQIVNGEEVNDWRLVTWVREKRNTTSWVEQIIDPRIASNYDKSKMEILASVALDCVMDDRNSRPTMSRVVEMLGDV